LYFCVLKEKKEEKVEGIAGSSEEEKVESLETLKEVELPDIQIQLVEGTDDEGKKTDAEEGKGSSEEMMSSNKPHDTSAGSFMSNFSTPKWINFRRVFSFNRSTPTNIMRKVRKNVL
jgi:hypothetical protein